MPGLSKQEVDKSLDSSVKDGSFYSVMTGFGDTYLVPFALRLGATNQEIGLLAALPQLASSVSQQISARLTEKYGLRKKTMVAGAFLQGATWLPILLAPFLFPETPVSFVILFAGFYAFFASFAALPWASLMGDLVPAESRGAFFGKRNEITGFAALVSSAVAGAVLGMFDSPRVVAVAAGTPVPLWLLGFCAIFSLAFLARMVSVYFLTKMAEPDYSPPKEKGPGFFAFIKTIRRNDFGVFTLYAAGTQFATYVASPFFTVYVLKELDFDYATFAAFTAAMAFVQFVSMPYWGRLADRYGVKTVLGVSGALIPVIPFLWLFSENATYLVLLNAFAGFAWAGFNLLTFNYVLDATEPATRPRFMAHYSMVNNAALFFGSLAGGLLAAYFSDKQLLWMDGLLLLFLLSGVLRAAIAATLLPRIREVRPRYDLAEKEFFWKAAAVYPIMGALHRLQWARRAGTEMVATLERTTREETEKLGERIRHGLSKKK